MKKSHFCWKATKVILMVLFIAALVTGAGGLPGTAQAQEDTGSRLFLPQVLRSPTPTWLGPDGGSVVCLKADPSNTNIVYAGTLSTGVYKTTNRGAAWTPISSGLGSMFIDSLEVDPNNGNIVYAGTHGAGVYKSVNGGASWFPVNTGIAENSVVYTVAVNHGNSNLVYAGTRIQDTYYHGITYKSTNGGASWSKVMDFSEDWVYSIAVNPSEPNVILAAVHTGGPVYSTDYGSRNSWENATPPALGSDYLVERWMKGRAVAFDPRGWTNGAYYTAWHDGMVSYSANDGQNWRKATGEVGDSHIYPNGISVKPGSPNVAYLAAHSSSVAGVLRSDSAGSSWEAAGLRGKTVYSVAALGGGGDTVLAGTYMDGLYKSDNGGASWYYSMSGITESNVTGMVFPGGNVVYASTKTGGGVFRSLDGGQTWSVFNQNLGDLNINGLVLHPTRPNILYALTNSAGLRRIDLSASGSWSPAEMITLENAQPVTESEGLFAPPPAPDDALAIDGERPMLPSPDESANAELNATAAAVSAPVLSMVFAPSNSQVAYLGTNGAGVYRSLDGGMNFSPAGLGGVARSLAVRPDMPEVIYAATNQNGVLRYSYNGGSTWQSAALPNASLVVYAVATVAADPNAVFVGTSAGVYRYDGAIWTLLGLGGSQVQVLTSRAADPGLLYAGTTSGAFRSSLDRQFWSPVANELGGRPISSLNFNPAEPNYIYVGTGGLGTLKVWLP